VHTQHTHAFTHTGTHRDTHTHKWRTVTHTDADAPTRARTHTHTHSHTDTQARTHTPHHTRTHTHTHTHTHKHTHTHIYTHIHTHSTARSMLSERGAMLADTMHVQTLIGVALPSPPFFPLDFEDCLGPALFPVILPARTRKPVLENRGSKGLLFEGATLFMFIVRSIHFLIQEIVLSIYFLIGGVTKDYYLVGNQGRIILCRYLHFCVAPFQNGEHSTLGTNTCVQRGVLRRVCPSLSPCLRGNSRWKAKPAGG